MDVVPVGYSHDIRIIRCYDSLVYLAGVKEWINESALREGLVGRRADVLRVILNDEMAFIVIWKDQINVSFREGWVYSVSFITTLKSAAALIPQITTYEITYKSDVKELSLPVDGTLSGRVCTSIFDLCSQVKVDFDEVDVVGIVGTVEKDERALLCDADDNKIVINFPHGIQNVGVGTSFIAGSIIGIMNLEVKQGCFSFGTRSLVVTGPRSNGMHLLSPLELLQLDGMDFESCSGFSAKSHARPATSINQLKSTCVELATRSSLLNFLTGLNVNVLPTSSFKDETRNTACVSLDPQHSFGIFGLAVFELFDWGKVSHVQDFYSRNINQFLVGLGFNAIISIHEMCKYFWINKGADENRIAVKLEMQQLGNYAQAKMTFFSDIFVCLEEKDHVHSRFLSPVVSVRCANFTTDTVCPCKLVNYEGLAVCRLGADVAIPSECPVFLFCKPEALYFGGPFRKTERIGVVENLNLDKELRVYNGLLKATDCAPNVYCRNCVTNKFSQPDLSKIMRYGVLEKKVNSSCSSDNCHKDLFILSFKM